MELTTPVKTLPGISLEKFYGTHRHAGEEVASRGDNLPDILDVMEDSSSIVDEIEETNKEA